MNFFKSGTNVTHVKSKPFIYLFKIKLFLNIVVLINYTLNYLIIGSDFSFILFFQIILKYFPDFLSAVSTTKSFEKILASLAPNPFLPPVVFYSLSS